MTIMPTASHRWVFWTLTLLGLAVDQGAKYCIFAGLYEAAMADTREHTGHIVVVPDTFHIVARFDPSDHPDRNPDRDFLAPLRVWGGRMQPGVNEGALFGIGQGNNLMFAAISIAAALFIMGWSMRSTAGRDGFLCVALGLILAGTLGNLYDRVVFSGVRDFLHWFRWYNWPVFNIADICLVFGAGMLLLEAFFRKPADQPANLTSLADDRIAGGYPPDAKSVAGS